MSDGMPRRDYDEDGDQTPVAEKNEWISESAHSLAANLPGELAFPSHPAYMEFKMSTAGLINFSVVAILLSLALFHIADPVRMPNINTHKRTLHSLQNYKVYPNGTKYFDYTDPENGESFHGLLYGWFEARLKGKYTYFFGLAFDNFCWPRDPVDSEWFPSLFRASQLKATVQVPLRAAVLLGIGFRFFQAIVIGYLKYYNNPTRLTKIIILLFVVNELIHNITLFGVSNYLVTKDEKYFYLFLPTLTTTYVTFGIKMLFSMWHTGVHILTFLRLFLLLLLSSTFGTIFTTTYSYLLYNHCDEYVTPLDGGMELMAVTCLILSEIFDVYQCRDMQIRVDVTKEEIDSTNWKLQPRA